MELIKLNKARQALIEAKSLDEILEIRDTSVALEAWCQAAKLGIKMQNECAEIKIRAEIKAGEFLKKRDNLKGGRPKQSQPVTVLKELGIGRMQSHRWQKMSSVPEEIRERHIKETIETEKELTSASMIRLATKDKPEIPPLPEGVFDVIYADPPWEYSNTGLVGMIEHQGHYSTMPLEKICLLEVPTAKNAVLFLWVTNPFLQESFDVVEAWGFKYKTNVVWIKKNLKKPGIGFYVRGQHELLLICIRGSFLPKSKEIVSSVLEADIGRHSEKPQAAYNLIEKLYPNCQYLELFARNKRESWTSWGNE